MRRAPHFAKLLLGGLLLIMLGLAVWKMGVLYVKLVQVTPTAAQIQSEAGILSLPQINFWTCQAGVFQQEENARRQLQVLAEQGWKSEIVAANPWTIGIGFSSKPEELQGLRLELAQAGINTMVKQVVVPERSFRISGNGVKETAAILTGVNALLRSDYAEGAWEKYIAAIKQGIYGNNIKELQQVYQNILYTQAAKDEITRQQSLLTVFIEYEKLLNAMSLH